MTLADKDPHRLGGYYKNTSGLLCRCIDLNVDIENYACVLLVLLLNAYNISVLFIVIILAEL